MSRGLQTIGLYDGDNLPKLRRYIPDASTDVIYLDQPFTASCVYGDVSCEERHRG